MAMTSEATATRSSLRRAVNAFVVVAIDGGVVVALALVVEIDARALLTLISAVGVVVSD